MSSSAENLRVVEGKMAAAVRASGREAGTVQLIAVSKTYDGPLIEPVIAAGQRVFGENRVQEAKGKWPALREKYPDLQLHLIGPLQSNKAREAVALFDAIHTIDREKIAHAVAREMAEQEKSLSLFIQVNTGLEPQKAGIPPGQTLEFADFCRNELGLEIAGLMCIPPFDEDPAPHFGELARLAAQAGLKNLSMGMSGDYEIAIALGATHVRVGSAIFGARSYA